MVSNDQQIVLGWVHNNKKYWENAYYGIQAVENYFGCTLPNSQQFTLTGLLNNTSYDIVFFPTRLGTIPLPTQMSFTSNSTGNLTIDLTNGGNNVLLGYDTANADFAYYITMHGMPRLLNPNAETKKNDGSIDFDIHPNPTNGLFTVIPKLNFQLDELSLCIYDLAGKEIVHQNLNSASDIEINFSAFPKGIYSVRLYSKADSKSKSIIIQ